MFCDAMHRRQTFSTSIVRMCLEIQNVQINVELIRWEKSHYNLSHIRAGIRNVPLISQAFFTSVEIFVKSL
jgi:hypothetical protein